MGLTKVSTDGVKDNTINTAKIINGAIQTEDIADNQIRTDKILDGEVTLAKLPHGTSSNDGKFLRANNGADPSFETVSIPAGTTINNNADNRVITGSGTANTLNAESSATFSSGQLKILTDGASGSGIRLVGKSGNSGAEIDFYNNADSSLQGYIEVSDAEFRAWNLTNTPMTFRTNNTERLRILAGGGLTFNGDTAAANALDDYEEGTWTPANVNFNTYSNVTWDAKYTKIGNLVFINAEMTGGDADWSTYDQLSGLPFQVIETAAGSWTTNGPAAGGEVLFWDNEYIYFANDFYGPSSHKLRISGFYITNQ